MAGQHPAPSPITRGSTRGRARAQRHPAWRPRPHLERPIVRNTGNTGGLDRVRGRTEGAADTHVRRMARLAPAAPSNVGAASSLVSPKGVVVGERTPPPFLAEGPLTPAAISPPSPIGCPSVRSGSIWRALAFSALLAGDACDSSSTSDRLLRARRSGSSRCARGAAIGPGSGCAFDTLKAWGEGGVSGWVEMWRAKIHGDGMLRDLAFIAHHREVFADALA